MNIQYISCTLKIKKSCGCTEKVRYEGERTGSVIDAFEKKQASMACKKCLQGLNK